MPSPSEEQAKTYPVVIGCHNCYRPNTRDIPFGTPVDLYLEGKPQTCSNCGCRLTR